MNIDKQIAIVTGAGSGLGEASARRLAAQGARVAVLDRSLSAAQAVAGDIDGLALGADVTDQAAVEAAFAEIQAQWGAAPRIALNCA
ncbi:MAG: SDR family NAD(P)-dependent oxidoreductase, partial [Paracoccus denitrificans]